MNPAFSRPLGTAVVLLIVAACTSCYNQPATYPQRTAASGALMGAGVGALVGSSRGETAAGALVGATAGAIAGGVYGERRAARYGYYGYGPAISRYGYGVPRYGYGVPRYGTGFHTAYPGSFYRGAIVHPAYRMQSGRFYNSGFYGGCPPYGRAYGMSSRFYY